MRVIQDLTGITGGRLGRNWEHLGRLFHSSIFFVFVFLGIFVRKSEISDGVVGFCAVLLYTLSTTARFLSYGACCFLRTVLTNRI